MKTIFILLLIYSVSFAQSGINIYSDNVNYRIFVDVVIDNKGNIKFLDQRGNKIDSIALYSFVKDMVDTTELKLTYNYVFFNPMVYSGNNWSQEDGYIFAPYPVEYQDDYGLALNPIHIDYMLNKSKLRFGVISVPILNPENDSYPFTKIHNTIIIDSIILATADSAINSVQLWYGTALDMATTQILTDAVTVTNNTYGQKITSFSNNQIPKNNWIRISTTGAVGVHREKLFVNIYYRLVL